MKILDHEPCIYCAAGTTSNLISTSELLQAAASRIRQLSEREYEVFQLLAMGPSNRDLADHLHVTERTIKAHVGRVLEKLGLSRLQAGIVSERYHAAMCTKGQLFETV